jgi:hypothetical protein
MMLRGAAWPKPRQRAEGVFVNVVDSANENWSFGNGLAQFA